MGMTDKQFSGYIKILLDDIKEIRSETDQEKRNEKLDKVIENLQFTLEA